MTKKEKQAYETILGLLDHIQAVLIENGIDENVVETINKEKQLVFEKCNNEKLPKHAIIVDKEKIIEYLDKKYTIQKTTTGKYVAYPSEVNIDSKRMILKLFYRST